MQCEINALQLAHYTIIFLLGKYREGYVTTAPYTLLRRSDHIVFSAASQLIWSLYHNFYFLHSIFCWLRLLFVFYFFVSFFRSVFVAGSACEWAGDRESWIVSSVDVATVTYTIQSCSVCFAYFFSMVIGLLYANCVISCMSYANIFGKMIEKKERWHGFIVLWINLGLVRIFIDCKGISKGNSKRTKTIHMILFVVEDFWIID